MSARPSNKSIVALAALALLLAPWALHRADWTLPESIGIGDASTVVRTQTAVAGSIAPGEPRRVPTAMPEGKVPVPSRQSDLRREFEDAPDLYAYVQRLAPAARGGDAEALWLISRVYDYCFGYALAPTAYARDTQTIGELKLRASAAMVAARGRVSRRCARFLPEDDLSVQAIMVKRVEAAEAGSLAAEAALLAMGEPLEEDDAYQRDLVERVKRSRDPDAYVALSTAMGVEASGKLALADQVAGTQFAELAWQLAACQLGLDCGPDSSLMTAYCANGGICSSDPDQDFPSFVYDAAIPRQGAEVVDTMVHSLVSE